MGDTPNKPVGDKASTKVATFTTTQVAQSFANKSTPQKSAERTKLQTAQAANNANSERMRALMKLLNRRFMDIGSTRNGGILCYPNVSAFGGSSKADNQWICSTKSQYRYREKNYMVQEHEVRVFVEGAEVTPYLRGTINWSIQTTGGVNTCGFTLNNNHDIFILTPANICAGLDWRSPGWRIPRGSGNRVPTHPGRTTRNVDETAKYIIYKNKFDRVRPGGPNPKISDDGIWLYPLDPWKPIFHTHDCVRVFCRLPHVSGVNKLDRGGKKVIMTKELWAPAFTGFISDHDFSDDPVTGDRLINIKCYDFRGLLDRMRVRVLGGPTASNADSQAAATSPVLARYRAGAASAAKGAITLVNIFDQKFLALLTELGIASWLDAWFNTEFANYIIAACGEKPSGECAKEVGDDVKAHITTTYVEPLKKNFKALLESIVRIERATSIKYEVVADNKSIPTIRLDKKVFDTADAQKAINAAIGFLQTDGMLAASYMTRYREVYMSATRGSYGLKQGGYSHQYDALLSPTTTQIPHAVEFDTAAIVAIDRELISKNATMGKVVSSAKPNIDLVQRAHAATYNRLYLLSNYLNTSIQEIIPPNPVVRDRVDGAIVGSRTLFRSMNKQLDGKTVASTVGYAFWADGAVPNLVATMKSVVTNGLKVVDDTANELNKDLLIINIQLKNMHNYIKSVFASGKKNNKSGNLRTEGEKTKLADEYKKAHAQGEGAGAKYGNEKFGNLADLIKKDAKFSEQNAGMFADLVRAQEKDAHPLAGMSFEMAVTWLTLTQLMTTAGYEEKLSAYNTDALSKWNDVTVFGVLGRPMTYEEVTEMGAGTITELDVARAPYSPLHCFVHLLLPYEGTGATTIVQQDITHNRGAVQDYSYKTRLSLLNEICELLDYQFFVSPVGDMVFEFPHYNAIPSDFGDVYLGAYTVIRGLRNATFSTNESQVPTAWVLRGSENERIADDVTSQTVISNALGTVVLVADMLARRIGVNVREIKVALPGVGAILQGEKPLSTLLAFAMLQMQREMGKVETISVTHEYRPYLIPNRPMHIVHRQRIALIKSVNYGMAVPGGECTAQTELHYTRGLAADGSFRFMGAGGARLPVDYAGLYTGVLKTNVKYGTIPTKEKPDPGVQMQSEMLKGAVSKLNEGYAPTDITNFACGPYLKDRYIESAASYSDQINSAFKGAEKFNEQVSGVSGQSVYQPAQTGQGFVGGRAFRPPSAKGDPAGSVSLDNTGISVANGQKKKQKTTETKSMGKFHNPWAFGVVDVQDKRVWNKKTKKWEQGKEQRVPFNQWGFFRTITASGNVQNSTLGLADTRNRPHAGRLGNWHNGLDFNGIKNLTQCYAPIELSYIVAELHTGSSLRDTSRYFKSKWQTGQKPNDTTLKLAWINPKTGKIGVDHEYDATTGISYDIYWIDTVGFKINHMLESKQIKVAVKSENSNLGLMVSGFGFVSMPHSPETKLACKLHYVHCGDLVLGEGNKYYYGDERSVGSLKCPADTVIVRAGQSGTNEIHLHLEMLVFPPGKEPGFMKGGTDASAYKDMLKANEEFLRASMRMKLTSGTGGTQGGDKLSDEWRQYFEFRNKYYNAGVTTVDAAVAYMLSMNTDYKRNTGRLTLGKGDGTYTNPLFFFTPDQIIKDYAPQYKNWQAKYGNLDFDAKKSSNVCGISTAIAKDKTNLEYAICLGKNRKQSNAWKKKQADGQCRITYKESLAAATNQTTRTAVAERTERKLNATMKNKVEGPRTPGDKKTAGA